MKFSHLASTGEFFDKYTFVHHSSTGGQFQAGRPVFEPPKTPMGWLMAVSYRPSAGQLSGSLTTQGSMVIGAAFEATGLSICSSGGLHVIGRLDRLTLPTGGTPVAHWE
jgi:hypothetical protein